MVKMIKMSIYVGLERDKDGRDISSFSEAILEPILKSMAETFGDYTRINSTGGYISDSNQLVQERSTKIEVLINEGDSVGFYLKLIKESLNQESILVTKEPLEALFY